MYEELIAVLDDLDIALDNGFGKASTFIACTKATRKVIELHKPIQMKMPHGAIYCMGCGRDPDFDSYWIEYPCPTVQAIAEEIK